MKDISALLDCFWIPLHQTQILLRSGFSGSDLFWSLRPRSGWKALIGFFEGNGWPGMLWSLGWKPSTASSMPSCPHELQFNLIEPTRLVLLSEPPIVAEAPVTGMSSLTSGAGQSDPLTLLPELFSPSPLWLAPINIIKADYKNSHGNVISLLPLIYWKHSC